MYDKLAYPTTSVLVQLNIMDSDKKFNLIVEVIDVNLFKTKIKENNWNAHEIAGNIFTMHNVTNDILDDLSEDLNIQSIEDGKPIGPAQSN